MRSSRCHLPGRSTPRSGRRRANTSSSTTDASTKRMTRRTLWGASAHVTSDALMPKSR